MNPLPVYGSQNQIHLDHDRIDVLLTDYLAARNAKAEDARARWRAFSEALRRHAEREETVLFPAYEANARPAASGALAALQQQHDAIRALLDRLDDDAPDPAREAREHELVCLLWDHEAREAVVFLPWLQGELGDEERRRLNERMAAGA